MEKINVMTNNVGEYFRSALKYSHLRFTLINWNTRTKISFYATPDSLSDTYSAKFDEKTVVGRSSPVLVYTGGSSRGLSFSVTFHEDLLENYTDITKFVDDIRALSFPVYDGGVKAPRVYCKVGNIFSFWGTLNTTVSYKPPIRDSRMIMADISFDFTRLGSILRSSSNLVSTVEDAYSVEESGLDRR